MCELGAFATTCCLKDRREGCCACFNNSCFECCAFGCCKDGCIGYTNNLCGCCGNCNLFCYATACSPCFVADLAVATTGDKTEWKRVATILITLGLFSYAMGMASPERPGQQLDYGTLSTAELVGLVLARIADVIEIIVYVFTAVTFGKAASRIAKEKGLNYEPADCCMRCCTPEEKKCRECCSSWKCCCAYSICFGCHMMQVARSMEDNQELVTNIVDKGRPEECQCCNCWTVGRFTMDEVKEMTQV